MRAETPIAPERRVSQITRETLALVLAGGQGSRLHELTRWRAKPAVPFGGKFRIIDFPLSNCVNSGISRMGVITQYKAHSLIRHLVQGWTHMNAFTGAALEILPASQRVDGAWYRGTADAIYQNIDIIRPMRMRYVMVLSGDHIYKMDYGPMLAFHADSGAQMTVSCLEVPVEEAANTYGVMVTDAEQRIVGFQEKPAVPAEIPGKPGMCLASMGNYVFDTEFLYDELIADADNPDSSHDFGKDIIPSLIDRTKVMAYPFRNAETGERAYWRDVGSLDAFWQANTELMHVSPELNLYDEGWPILTYQAQLPPAKFIFNDEDRRGMCVDSMVSGGCLISGAYLESTLLFSNVRVNSYAQIHDSVVLPDVDIGRHCRIRKAIIDRGCWIPERTVIGEDHETDKARGFRVSENGVVLVTPDMLGQSLHQLR